MFQDSAFMSEGGGGVEERETLLTALSQMLEAVEDGDGSQLLESCSPGGGPGPTRLSGTLAEREEKAGGRAGRPPPPPPPPPHLRPRPAQAEVEVFSSSSLLNLVKIMHPYCLRLQVEEEASSSREQVWRHLRPADGSDEEIRVVSDGEDGPEERSVLRTEGPQKTRPSFGAQTGTASLQEAHRAVPLRTTRSLSLQQYRQRRRARAPPVERPGNYTAKWPRVSGPPQELTPILGLQGPDRCGPEGPHTPRRRRPSAGTPAPRSRLSLRLGRGGGKRPGAESLPPPRLLLPAPGPSAAAPSQRDPRKMAPASSDPPNPVLLPVSQTSSWSSSSSRDRAEPSAGPQLLSGLQDRPPPELAAPVRRAEPPPALSGHPSAAQAEVLGSEAGAAPAGPRTDPGAERTPQSAPAAPGIQASDPNTLLERFERTQAPAQAAPVPAPAGRDLVVHTQPPPKAVQIIQPRPLRLGGTPGRRPGVSAVLAAHPSSDHDYCRAHAPPPGRARCPQLHQPSPARHRRASTSEESTGPRPLPTPSPRGRGGGRSQGGAPSGCWSSSSSSPSRSPERLRGEPSATGGSSSRSPQRRYSWSRSRRRGSSSSSSSSSRSPPARRPRPGGCRSVEACRRLRSAPDSRKQQLRAVDERRVVYVGRIRGSMTPQELRERFGQFGQVECVSLHFRETGDHYAFVTFCSVKDAFAAIDNGGRLRRPDEKPFDLCFGGRRHFCCSEYTDLDADREADPPARSHPEDLDFDQLLKQAQGGRGRPQEAGP